MQRSGDCCARSAAANAGMAAIALLVAAVDHIDCIPAFICMRRR